MYGKLFDQIYDGTLATKGPWQALVTFQQFIVLADSHGIVDMTAESISRRTTIPLKIIQHGIAALEQPDADSRTPDEEGRRIVRLSDTRSWGWRIVNHAKYRAIRSQEERRDYMRQYQRERREKQRVNQNVNTVNNVNPCSKQEAVHKNHNHSAPEQDSGGGDQLIWPERLNQQERQGITELISKHRLNGNGQLLLDEIAGAMYKTAVTNPVGYARKIIAAMENNSFVAEKAHCAVQARKKRAAQEEQEREELKKKSALASERRKRGERSGYEGFKSLMAEMKGA